MTEQDVIDIAASMNVDVSEEEVSYIIRNYEYMTDDMMTSRDSVVTLIHHIKSQWNE